YQYQDHSTGVFLKRKKNALPPVGATIPDGPLAHGFDFFHGFHHSRDMDAVVENTKVI
ncbi:MAG TPA: arylsulfatase, partial [Planctomycetaceae bacterium]|nr:arylsulfatase [Planctomycetaceae bacterium]